MKGGLFYTKIVLLLGLVFALSACGSLPDKPDHVGHVIAVDEKEKRILVVSALTDEEVQSYETEELLEIDEQRARSAVWFSGGGIQYEVGDKVQVWIRDIDDAYPGNAVAKAVKKY